MNENIGRTKFWGLDTASCTKLIWAQDTACTSSIIHLGVYLLPEVSTLIQIEDDFKGKSW